MDLCWVLLQLVGQRRRPLLRTGTVVDSERDEIVFRVVCPYLIAVHQLEQPSTRLEPGFPEDIAVDEHFENRLRVQFGFVEHEFEIFSSEKRMADHFRLASSQVDPSEDDAARSFLVDVAMLETGIERRFEQLARVH